MRFCSLFSCAHCPFSIASWGSRPEFCTRFQIDKRTWLRRLIMRFALSRLILGLLLIGLASALLLFSDLNHRTTRVGQRQPATSGIVALSTANEQNAAVSKQAPALSKGAATDGTSLAPALPGVSKAPAHRWNMHFINFVDAAHVEETLDGFFQDFKKL